jgi:hypothetical protein
LPVPVAIITGLVVLAVLAVAMDNAGLAAICVLAACTVYTWAPA